MADEYFDGCNEPEDQSARVKQLEKALQEILDLPVLGNKDFGQQVRLIARRALDEKQGAGAP